VIAIRITSDAVETRRFLVQVEGSLRNRRGLHAVLANRLADEMKDHFSAKNRQPNKLGGKKTNFWQDVADSTAVGEVTDTGASVTVAEVRFRIQLFGGTIRPTGGRKALTIPLIPEAHGLRAGNYEQETGRKLFTIRGKKALFERTGAPTGEALTGRVRRRNGTSKSVGLISRTGVRPVFALVKSATIRKDPDALPDTTLLVTALQQEADDFIQLNTTPA